MDTMPEATSLDRGWVIFWILFIALYESLPRMRQNVFVQFSPSSTDTFEPRHVISNNVAF